MSTTPCAHPEGSLPRERRQVTQQGEWSPAQVMKSSRLRVWHARCTRREGRRAITREAYSHDRLVVRDRARDSEVPWKRRTDEPGGSGTPCRHLRGRDDGLPVHARAGEENNDPPRGSEG